MVHFKCTVIQMLPVSSYGLPAISYWFGLKHYITFDE